MPLSLGETRVAWHTVLAGYGESNPYSQVGLFRHCILTLLVPSVETMGNYRHSPMLAEQFESYTTKRM
jgi:hypothetical protein